MSDIDNKKNSYLLKNIIIFAISIFGTKIIYFFLVPLYTNCLNPSEYGIVDLLFTISNFLFPVFTLNITEAIYRFSLDKNANYNKIFSIGIICTINCILFGLVLIPIVNSFNNYKDYSFLFYLYIISLSFSQILLSLSKGQEKLKLFAFANIFNSILIACLNIVLLLVYGAGIEGYFWSYIIANIVVCIIIILFGKYYNNFTKISFDSVLFKSMVKYSVVLIPTSFLWWIMHSSDRIMISNMIGDYENGIYGISYKIPSLLTVISFIFTQAWSFSAIKNASKSDNEIYTNKIFEVFIKVLCIIGVFIILIIRPLFKIYVASDYFVAWKYVPFLVLGYVFMTSSTFISSSYNVHKDSKGFLYSGMVGAIVNIILNIILIPILKIYGAAIATMISYISVFIYRMIDTKKYLKIKILKSQTIYISLLIFSCVVIYVPNSYLFIALILLMLLIMSLRDILFISKIVFTTFKEKNVKK